MRTTMYYPEISGYVVSNSLIVLGSVSWTQAIEISRCRDYAYLLLRRASEGVVHNRLGAQSS